MYGSNNNILYPFPGVLTFILLEMLWFHGTLLFYLRFISITKDLLFMVSWTTETVHRIVAPPKGQWIRRVPKERWSKNAKDLLKRWTEIEEKRSVLGSIAMALNVGQESFLENHSFSWTIKFLWHYLIICFLSL